MNTQNEVGPLAALVCVDFINEIISPSGKLSGKGYYDYSVRHDVLDRVRAAQDLFRSRDMPVIHVRVGFSANYLDKPDGSPLFGKADQFGALSLGAEGTQFLDPIAPLDDEIVITKHRVSAFYGTGLDSLLRNRGIRRVFLSGVATDLAVESAARDAHDRDYLVTVISDCCAAASDADHARSLESIAKIASVSMLDGIEI